MHDAHNLFEYKGCDTKNLPPLSHRDDPQTSYEAADNMIKSGKLARQEEEVYQTILTHLKETPWKKDFTAKELRYLYLDYYVCQRRLSGLHRKGLIERTGQKRDGCCVWRLI